MNPTFHLKTDWMGVKTTVDIKLLYQTLFKERLIAHAVPSVAHIQLLTEARTQRPDHFSPRWENSDKPRMRQSSLSGQLSLSAKTSVQFDFFFGPILLTPRPCFHSC